MDPHTHTHTVEMEVDTNTPTKKQEKKKKRETLNRRNTPFFENGQYYRSYGSRKQRRGHQEKKKKRGRKKGNSSLFLFSSLFKCSRSCKPTDNVAERRGKIQALCMYADQKSTLQYTNKKAHNHIRSSERDIVCSGKKKKEYLHSWSMSALASPCSAKRKRKKSAGALPCEIKRKRQHASPSSSLDGNLKPALASFLLFFFRGGGGIFLLSWCI